MNMTSCVCICVNVFSSSLGEVDRKLLVICKCMYIWLGTYRSGSLRNTACMSLMIFSHNTSFSFSATKSMLRCRNRTFNINFSLQLNFFLFNSLFYLILLYIYSRNCANIVQTVLRFLIYKWSFAKSFNVAAVLSTT